MRSCSIDREADPPILRLEGDWTLRRLKELRADAEICSTQMSGAALRAIDGASLSALDTAAALQVCRWLRAADIDPRNIALQNFDPRHQRVLRQVAGSRACDIPEGMPDGKDLAPRMLARLGRTTLDGLRMLATYLAFLGQVCVEIGAALLAPRRLRLGELITQLSRVCLEAVPVIMLVTCLIGLVFAYLLGLQAEQYGANIFVVDGVALGMAREFSPLIVAVIAAGRSGAAFAAQLGTMRLNEETDAIAVLGLSPVRVLIVPRVLALVLAMPLLVFVGDLAGLAGAAVIASLMLDITPATFIARLHDNLPIRHVLIGLLKAPVFGMTIAIIACAMGSSGPRDTRTIGVNTTSTVVQGIVWVILIDAVYAIVLQWVGW